MDRTTRNDTPTAPARRASRRPSHRRLVAAASVALLVAGLGACGGDDDDTATDAQQGADGSDGPTTEGGSGGTEEAAGEDVDAYCTAVLSLEQTAALADPEADPVAFAESLLVEATAVEEVAPAEVAPAVSEGIAILQGVADTGDPSQLAGLEAATAPMHEFDLANCGWEVSDVTMADFSFTGIGDEMTAGVHSFELANEGAEAHVLVLVRKAEGVTQSWEEILAAGEGTGLYEDRWPAGGRPHAGRLHGAVPHPHRHDGGRRGHRPAPLRPRHDPRVHGRLTTRSGSGSGGVGRRAPDPAASAAQEFTVT